MPRNYAATADHISRVLLADDHRLIGEAVATLLSTTERFSVDTAETFDETISCLVNDGPYDIVMLDLRMPGLVGLEGVRQVVGRPSCDCSLITSVEVSCVTLLCSFLFTLDAPALKCTS